MFDVNYTGQNVPVISFLSEFGLSEQEYIELYRNDERFMVLVNQFCKARIKFFKGVSELAVLHGNGVEL